MTPDAFIKEIATVYGPPKTENPSRYVEIVRDTVSAFKPAEIELAADALIEKWTYRRWPTPAELRKFLSDAGAKLAAQKPAGAPQEFVRNRIWTKAYAWRDDWFSRRGNPWLIDKAELEGWTEDLRHIVATMAHSCLVSNAGGQPPRDDQIVIEDWRMEYYCWKRTAYRLGSYAPPKVKPGNRINWARVQSKPGEAISAAMDGDE